MLRRVNELIRATQRDPFHGPGKPEPLRHMLSGYWARRIDAEHRMVYTIEGDSLLIAQLRYHYEWALSRHPQMLSAVRSRPRKHGGAAWGRAPSGPAEEGCRTGGHGGRRHGAVLAARAFRA